MSQFSTVEKHEFCEGYSDVEAQELQLPHVKPQTHSVSEDTNELDSLVLSQDVLKWLLPRRVVPVYVAPPEGYEHDPTIESPKPTLWHLSEYLDPHSEINTQHEGVGSRPSYIPINVTDLVLGQFGLSQERLTDTSRYSLHTKATLNTMRNSLVDRILEWSNKPEPYLDAIFSRELAAQCHLDAVFCYQDIRELPEEEKMPLFNEAKHLRTFVAGYDSKMQYMYIDLDNIVKDMMDDRNKVTLRRTRDLVDDAMKEPLDVVCDFLVSLPVSIEAANFQTDPTAFDKLRQFVRNNDILVREMSTKDQISTYGADTTHSETNSESLLIHLPLLVVADVGEMSGRSGAFNVCQMAVVSAAAFMRCLGIDDYPIFGLVATPNRDTGTVVSLLYAYAPRTDPYNAICLKGYGHRTFNIGTQDGLASLELFLGELERHAAENLQKLRSAIVDYAETNAKMSSDLGAAYLPWTSQSQLMKKQELERVLRTEGEAYIKKRNEVIRASEADKAREERGGLKSVQTKE